jgi:hypothetical protein
MTEVAEEQQAMPLVPRGYPRGRRFEVGHGEGMALLAEEIVDPARLLGGDGEDSVRGAVDVQLAAQVVGEASVESISPDGPPGPAEGGPGLPEEMEVDGVDEQARLRRERPKRGEMTLGHVPEGDERHIEALGGQQGGDVRPRGGAGVQGRRTGVGGGSHLA